MSWIRWNGNGAASHLRGQMSQALVAAGEALKAEVNKVVPLDEGTLQASVMEVPVIKNPDNDLEVLVTAGGGEGTGFPRVPYARRWHEHDANFQHGRKSNYLRGPLMEKGPAIMRKAMQNVKI